MRDQQQVHIVALGASNTEGWGVTPAEAYPAQLEALLRARGIDAEVANKGISGEPTTGMLARLDRDVPEGTRVVILQPGINDEFHGQGHLRAGNIAEMRRRLDARGITVVMMENEMLRALPASERRPDGIHFTPEGYRLLAANILPDVLVVLERLGAGR
jgi:acyl-CoA thioesterase-1